MRAHERAHARARVRGKAQVPAEVAEAPAEKHALVHETLNLKPVRTCARMKKHTHVHAREGKGRSPGRLVEGLEAHFGAGKLLW